MGGVVSAVTLDDLAQGVSKIEYQLEDAQSHRHVALHFDGAAPEGLRSGTYLEVSGLAGDDANVLSVGSATPSATQTATTGAAMQTTAALQTTAATIAAPLVSGVQNTIVIIANFTDANVASTPSQIQDLMFTDPTGASIDALFRETSFGNVGFSGKVVGPFVINYSTTSTCNLAAWADAAEAAATAAGWDLSQYPRRLYVMPSNEMSVCGADGAAQVGGSPSRAWVFNYTAKDVFAHELGHNLNMAHAATLANQYGDASDDMSADGYALRHFNAPHMEQMGWTPASNILTVTQSGTYTVATLETNPAQASAAQILKIFKPDTGEYYYLSYRQPLGLDSGLRSAYWNRINVHKYTGNYDAYNTYLLALLDDAGVYSDATNGISVTQLSHTSNYATVQIQLPGGSPAPTCQAAAPVLSMNPSSQSGSAGSKLSYTISLTNKDNAYCATSTFALAAAMPAGWTGSVSPATLSLAPGASATATLSVTSPTSAAAATYTVQVNASDAATTAHNVSGSVSDIVQAQVVQADTQAPSVPGALTASVARRTTVSLTWAAATDNVGVSGYEVWRNGVRVATTATPGYTEMLPSGTYSYYVVAYDAAGNHSGASNSASVTIRNK